MLLAPEPLTPAHGLTGFDSGVASLDEWLLRRALRNQASGASRTFVVSEAGRVVAYYALAASAVAADDSTSGKIYLAALNPDDALEQAMRLLKRPDLTSPTREEVDRAGHILMEAGPGAFERAMQLLKRPTQFSSDAEIEAAKKQMASGGPDAHTKAMQILLHTYGYK